MSEIDYYGPDTICPCPVCVEKREKFGASAHVERDRDGGLYPSTGPLKVDCSGIASNGRPNRQLTHDERLQRCEIAIERLAEIFKRMDRTSQEGELIRQYIRRDF